MLLTVRKLLPLLFLVALTSSAMCATNKEPSDCAEGLPLDVSLSIGVVPLVGQEGTVAATITADYDLPDAVLTVQITPDGSVVGSATIELGDLPAKTPLTYFFKVKFPTAGNKFVRAAVKSQESPGLVWSAVGYLPLNLGAKRSYAGLDETLPLVTAKLVGKHTGRITGEPSAASKSIVGPPPPAKGDLVGPSFTGKPSSKRQFRATITVSGNWGFYDRFDTWTPQRVNCVQLRRGSDGAHLAYAYTDWNGDYTFPAVTNPGAAGVYVRCFTYTNYGDPNIISTITLGGSSWSNCYYADTATYVFSDGANSVGGWSISNGTGNEKAWWIKDDLTKAFSVPPNSTGRHVVEWSSSSTHGTHYHRDGNIHLKAGDADDTPDTVLHEMGHSVMWNVYGDWMSSNDCPSPHYVNKASGPHCGWNEGWAEIWHMWMNNDPVRSWPGGGSVNYENATWGTSGWDNGDYVEGRVAGAVWDIIDDTSDGYDMWDDDWSSVWDVVYNANSSDFPEFWSSWASRGHNTHGPVACLYQCTIDYDTAPTFSGIPDISVAKNSSNDNILDCWVYAYDPESNDAEVTYTIVGNTNPDCGVSIDGWGYIDVTPTTNWSGSSTVTIRCSDGIYYADDSFVITVTP